MFNFFFEVRKRKYGIVNIISCIRDNHIIFVHLYIADFKNDGAVIL